MSRKSKKRTGFPSVILALAAVLFLLAQPILACQFAAASAPHEGMACCQLEGGCQHAPEERADCCLKHSGAPGEKSSLLLPLKETWGIAWIPAVVALIPTVLQVEVPSLCLHSFLSPEAARGQPPGKIYLRNASFLI